MNRSHVLEDWCASRVVMGNRFWRKSQMVNVPSWLPVATICSCPGCLSTHSKALWSSILKHPSSQTKATMHAQCPFKPLASPGVSTPSYLSAGVHTVFRPTLHQYADQHWNSMQTNTAPACIPTLHWCAYQHCTSPWAVSHIHHPHQVLLLLH